MSNLFMFVYNSVKVLFKNTNIGYKDVKGLEFHSAAEGLLLGCETKKNRKSKKYRKLKYSFKQGKYVVHSVYLHRRI